MPVQVQEQLHLPLPRAPAHQFAQRVHFGVVLLAAGAEFAVEIVADDAGAVVADEHAVGVEHGHDFEADVLAQQPLLDLPS